MGLRLLCVCALSLLVRPLDAAVAGFTEIKSLQGITEYRLDSNGLTVLLLPEHSAPAVTFMVTYRIGSRNESYGTTGATHLLEHLMFKGTAKHNKEAGNGLDQLLEGIGAETNATTWLDRTNYITTLGPQNLPVIVGLEADRMRNLRLREEDRRPEMTVVHNEFELAENDPAGALDREIWAAAYLAHPYRHSALGWISDVENVPIEKLREFYDTYYWPDNATVSVIGDFEADAVLALLKEQYSTIPKAPHPIPRVYTVEPAQTGPRRVTLKRPGELGVVTIAYKSPAAADPDYPALAVLCEILADGRNSRFYRELTDRGMTTDVSARAEFTLDPSLLLITAGLTGESNHAAVEEKLLAAIDALIAKGASEEETKTAIARICARSSFERDGSASMAFSLNDCVAVGDWTLFHTYLDAVRRVSAADVQRVAQKWLLKDRSTTGWFIPDAGTGVEEPDAPGDDVAATPPAPPLILPEVPPASAVEVAKIAPRVVRSRSGGLDLLVCPTGAKDLVVITGGIPFGDATQQVLASFVAQGLQRGTSKLLATEIEQRLDEVGASIETGVHEGSVDFSARCLKKDLPLVVGLLAEQLRTPAFPEDEIEKLRTQLVADAVQGRADTNLQAAIAFSRAAFPVGHPNRQQNTEETLNALKSISREDLIGFHRKWMGPAGATLVVTGDVDPAICQGEIEKAFHGWSGGQIPETPPAAAKLAGPLELQVPIPGKESVTLMIGQASGLKFRDPDFLPLSLATAALGRGFTSRLLNTVRDTEGLTYGVRADLRADSSGDGAWAIAGSFAPQLLDRGLGSVRRELGKWHQEGLSAEEFAYRQSGLIGAHRVQLATSENLAATLLATVQRGLPVSWLDDYAGEVSKLTRDQVNEVIRRRLDPAAMIVVKSGSLP